MGLSLLESLRRLIRQDTNRVGGPVGNLHGVVASQLGGLVDGAPQSWLMMEVPGALVPDIEGFYQNYGILGGRLVLLVAQDGQVIAEAQSGSVTMLRSAAIVRQRTTFSFKIEATGNYALYVDNTLVRRGQGTSLVPVTLEPGTHELAVLTNSERTAITAPLALELQGDLELPARPVWVGISTEYLDPSIGTAANTLSWVSDPKVGGYYVLRRQRRRFKDLTEGASPTDASLLAIGEVGSDGSFPVTIEGRHEEQFAVGDELLSEYDTIGIVTQVGTESGTNTSLRCRVLPGTLPPNASLLGNECFVGTFSPLTQITRTTNAPTLTYVDNTVIFGEVYEYALIAYGLVNPALRGLRSEVKYVVAGDVFPPSSIEFEEDYPKSENGFVTVRFLTPPEKDYQGVNVYWHERVLNEAALDEFVPYRVASAAGRVITLNDPELPPGGLVGYKARLTTGQEYTIESNTAAAITVERDLARPPLADEEVEIYRNVKIKTDYGQPNSRDELSFTATDTGRYVFCTFDRSGNEQDDRDAAYFDLFSLSGSGEGQPIVAFRQLIPTEQSIFSAPYNDPTQYAIVELWGYNSGVDPARRFEGVELFYRRRSDQSDRMITPLPFSGQAFPWIVSGAPQAILDAPNWVTGSGAPPIVSGGILSRYVHLDRTQQDNWIRIWAENEAGFSTSILTFVVDYDTTPEITSLEATIDNEGDTASFTVVIDDDTQAITWWVNDPDGNEPSEASPAHLGSKTIKSLEVARQIKLPLGRTKRLFVKPWSNWETRTATVTSVSGNVITCSGANFPTANGGMARQRLTYSGGRVYTVQSNTATTVTVRETLSTPLPVNGTTISIGYATGTEGEVVERELVRVPRSFVSFENKNEKGERDVKKVTATFSQLPVPEVIPGQGGTGTLSLTGGFKLSDGTKAWTVNQFSSASPTAWYYIRMTGSVSGKTLVRRIVANTATVLELDGGLPEGTSIAEFANQPYVLLDGAVNVRQRVVDPTNPDIITTVSGLVPTSGKETYDRDKTFYLDYFATKNGCVAENQRTTLVDPDTDASLGALTLSYGTATRKLTARVAGTDDDTKYWELFLKRGSWPTTNNPATSDGPVDPRFLRYQSVDVSTTSLTYTQTVEPGNTWYAIAVPYNSFNQPGVRKTASIDTSSSSGTFNAMTGLAFRPQTTTTTAYVDVFAQGGASGNSFTVTAWDAADPATVLTASDAFALPIHGGDTLGTVTLTLPYTASATPTANRRTVVVKATSPGKADVQAEFTYFATVGGGGGGTGGTTPTITAGSVDLFDEGFCPVGDGCTSPVFRPLSLRVNWTSSNTSNVTNRIEIDMHEGFGPDDWFPVGFNLVPVAGAQSYVYTLPCRAYRPTGTNTPFKFRVRVVRTDTWATVASSVSGTYTTKVAECTVNDDGIF